MLCATTCRQRQNREWRYLGNTEAKGCSLLMLCFLILTEPS